MNTKVNSALSPAGYLIGNAETIFAVGRTVEEAAADYRDWSKESIDLDCLSADPHSGQLFIVPATQALIDAVKANGGSIGYETVRQPVGWLACLPAEAE